MPKYTLVRKHMLIIVIRLSESAKMLLNHFNEESHLHSLENMQLMHEVSFPLQLMHRVSFPGLFIASASSQKELIAYILSAHDITHNRI